MKVELEQHLVSNIKSCLAEFGDPNNGSNYERGFFCAIGLLEKIATIIDEEKIRQEEHIEDLINSIS